MSVARLFTIIGDGNVRRNMTGLNMASRDTMKNAQIIDYTAPASFDASFNEVRAEAEVCIIAALTDLILAGGDSGTISASIDPILLSFRTKLFDFCASRPALQASSQHVITSVITSGKFEHFHQARYSGILSVAFDPVSNPVGENLAPKRGKRTTLPPKRVPRKTKFRGSAAAAAVLHNPLNWSETLKL